MVNIFRSLALFATTLLLINVIWAGLLVDDNSLAIDSLTELRAIRSELSQAQSHIDADRAAISNLEQQSRDCVERIQPALHGSSLHFLFLIATSLIATLVSSITVTYFIGTSRWCKEVVGVYGLDSELARQSTLLKRKCFPWALGGIAMVLLVAAVGGAANPAVRLDAAAAWIKWFPVVAILGALVVMSSFRRQAGFLATNHELIQRILSDVQRVREQRGLAGFSIVFVCALLVSSAVLNADDEVKKTEEETPFGLTSVLARPLIEPNLSLREVQAYTESRVPIMPEFKTVADWDAYARRIRRDILSRVVLRGNAEQWSQGETKSERVETIDGGPGYRIHKLRYEAVPGLWIPALLYEPDKLDGLVPVVMNVNGHDGTGKAAKYKQLRCINQAKRGMLALNVEWLGMGQLNALGFRHYHMNQLNLCGTSGLAPFYLSMKRGLDVLLSHPNADPQRVAVAGLSGGGWQTIFISALDERVTLSNPVAGYSSFRTRARYLSDLGDSEQTPNDLATVADYAHLTALRAPRPTLLTNNANDDCCFRADHALPPLLEAARPIYALYGRPSHLRYHINHEPGDHNFGVDNRQQLYRMFGDFFFADQDDFDWHEIPSQDEVKSAEQLHVDLPEDNADFNLLARRLSQSLPVVSTPRLADHDVAAWRNLRRRKLQ